MYRLATKATKKRTTEITSQSEIRLWASEAVQFAAHTVCGFDLHGRDVRHGDSRKSQHTTGKSHDDRYYRRYR